jgi:hypothetical protein
MTRPAIRVVRRTNVDWRTPQRRLPRPTSLTPQIQSVFDRLDNGGILDIWDRAFATDFFAFRDALERISFDNISAVDGATVTSGFADFASWYASDSDEMLYPIDDDDWFHPRLVDTTPDATDGTAVVLWPHVVYTYGDDGAPVLATRPVEALLTNNWGVRKSFLREHFSDEDAQQILTNHALASMRIARALGIRDKVVGGKWWEVALHSPAVRHLPDSYGVSLIHVGSMLRLLRAVDSESESPFGALRLTERASVPPELSWTQPWISEAEAVFRSLPR